MARPQVTASILGDTSAASAVGYPRPPDHEDGPLPLLAGPDRGRRSARCDQLGAPVELAHRSVEVPVPPRDIAAGAMASDVGGAPRTESAPPRHADLLARRDQPACQLPQPRDPGPLAADLPSSIDRPAGSQSACASESERHARVEVPAGSRRRLPRASPHELCDSAWLRQHYVTDGGSLADLAEVLGCSREAVRRALCAARIPRRAPAQPAPFRRLWDRGWLRERYLDQNASVEAIAREVGRSQAAVRRALHRAGIRRHRRASRLQTPQLHDPSWLAARYLAEGTSQRHLAAALGCSVGTLRAALRRAGLPTTRAGSHPARLSRLNQREWLEAQYVTERKTDQEIAAGLGCHPATVARALRRAGIARRRGGRLGAAELADAAWLAQRYVHERRSLADIGSELGCSREAVTGALRRAGIARRRGGRLGAAELADAAWLAQRYLDERRSLADIGSELGCSREAVRRALGRAGIGLRPPGAPRRPQSGSTGPPAPLATSTDPVTPNRAGPPPATVSCRVGVTVCPPAGSSL
ncbi:MAG: hypothetical protein ACYDAQ_05995 [Mycobacteriales bacterium]